ncbi:MAG: hypothetical protein ACP5KE_06835, partial [Candidatus Methanodesulfokora sp.]
MAVAEIIDKYPLVLHYLGLSYTNKRVVQSDDLYFLLRKIEELAYPTREDDYVRSYYYFFLPIKMRSGIKFAPVLIFYLKENDEYDVCLHTAGCFTVRRGNQEPDELYVNFLRRLHEFAVLQIKNPIFITTDMICKRYLVGRIKLKYVTKPQMKIEEAREIMKQYRKNKALRLESD